MIIEPEVYTLKRNKAEDRAALVGSTKCEVGGYAKEFIASGSFKLPQQNEEVPIRLVKFDKDCLVSEILEAISKAGFILPQASDALSFATQYPDVQTKYPVAFLHTPWIRPETGGENVLILREYAGVRFLHMHLFDSRWYSHVWFAVIAK
jgi:hypothetical protein